MSDLFSDVIGHRSVIGLLETELANPAHAYLFVGPGSVGKETVARRFAAGLLDPGGDASARSIRLAIAGSHPDLTIVEPEGAVSIGVDQAREMVARSSMSPVEGRRSVFLVPDSGSMTEPAANSLLKTLEEPSPSAVFILVSESEDDLPATVGSRCRTVQFGRVSHEELVTELNRRGLTADQADGVALVSGGRPGLAIALMTRPEVSEFRDLWLGIPGRVSPHPGDGHRLAELVLSDLAPMVDQAVSDSVGKDEAQRARRRVEMSLLVSGLEILASWYADSASLQVGGPVRNADLSLGELADVSPRAAVSSADRVLDAVIDIQANLRRELVLANLFTELGSAG